MAALLDQLKSMLGGKSNENRTQDPNLYSNPIDEALAKLRGDTTYVSPIPQDQTLDTPRKQADFSWQQFSKKAPPVPGMVLAAQTSPSTFAQANATTPYADVIEKTAAKYGIDPYSFAALLKAESGGFQDKYIHGYHRDGTGRGIAAIDKKYHPEVSDEQAFDPNFAIDWAGNKMSQLQKTAGNPRDALRMYNGGGNYDSPQIGYGGRTVRDNTNAYADAIEGVAKTFKR